MAYNTGNALGSTDARDLYDNAANLDTAVNSTAVGWVDRLGVSRKSFAGMEDDFQSFLLSSGYEDVGTYTGGLVVTARNQIFIHEGEYYRAAAATVLPYTTTGSWSDDFADFVSIGDAALRSDLASSADTTIGYYRNAINVLQFGTLEEARTNSDASGKIVVVTTVLTEAQSNILGNWPDDRILRIEKGGQIANSTAFVLDPGAIFDAGYYEIFTGAGSVDFSGCNTTVLSCWFATASSAFASNPKTIEVCPGTHANVTVATSNITVKVLNGAVFQSAAATNTPAIKFTGDNVSIQGRLVADGNKANNTNSYVDGDIGYEYSTAVFYGCDNLNMPDGVYCFNAWHDGICFQDVTNSQIGNLQTATPEHRSVTIYAGVNNTTIGDILVDGTGATDNTHEAGIRIGGASGNGLDSVRIGNITSNKGDLLVEQYTTNVTIGDVFIKDSVSNGVKFAECQNITAGNVLVDGAYYNGIYIGVAETSTENITIGNVTIFDSLAYIASGGTGAGVFIDAQHNTGTNEYIKGISIGNIISRRGGGGGFRIQATDATTSITQVTVGNIITTDHTGYGIFIYDDNTVDSIALGDIISTGNAAGSDFRIENAVSNISWGKLHVGSVTNNQVGPTDAGVKNKLVLDASAQSVSTSGTGVDILKSKTIGAGTLGATGALHIVAAGTKSGSGGNKTIHFYFGTTAIITFHPAANNTEDWFVEAYVYNVTATTQVISVIASGGGTASTELTTGAVDTTAAISVSIRAECANAGDAVVQNLWLIERI